MTISQLESADQDVCQNLTEGLLELLKWTTDLEGQYRSYQALGNLTCTDFKEITSAQIVSVDAVFEIIRGNMSANQPEGFVKLNEVARDLATAL